MEKLEARERDIAPGISVYGYVVKLDTGWETPGRDKIFLCECASCGARRTIPGRALAHGLMTPCPCAESLELVELAVAPPAPMSKSAMIEAVKMVDRLGSAASVAFGEEPAHPSFTASGSTCPAAATNCESVYRMRDGGRTLVATYESRVAAVKALASELGLQGTRVNMKHLRNKLSKAITGYTLSYKGDAWISAGSLEDASKTARERSEHAHKLRHSPTAERPVAVTPVNGRGETRVFESIKKAVAAISELEGTAISYSVIAKICHRGGGRRYGYHWSYATDSLVRRNVRVNCA